MGFLFSKESGKVFPANDIINRNTQDSLPCYETFSREHSFIFSVNRISDEQTADLFAFYQFFLVLCIGGDCCD